MATKVRMIKFSNENGSKEAMFFTDDFTSIADEWVPDGLTVDFDVVTEIENLPDAFPMNYFFDRE